MLSETKKLSESAWFDKIGLFPKLSGCLHEEAPELPPDPVDWREAARLASQGEQ